MLLHRMALVSSRLFCKNLGNLQEFFGQMVYRPPPAENCPYAYGGEVDENGESDKMTNMAKMCHGFHEYSHKMGTGLKTRGNKEPGSRISLNE